MSDVSRAKAELVRGGYTCVLIKGERKYLSQERGVKPLVGWLESGEELRGCFAADKVVGKATAFLYCLAGVSALSASVISEPALRVLKSAGIHVEYDTLVPNIINRRGDGICPFELSVLGIEEADAAYAEILRKMRELGIR